MTDAKSIAAALRKKYGSGFSTAIAFEVAHGTGRHANRHMDAVVMELWPSRGLTLHAIEIKCSVSDLKREIADGSKAEEIAQHCDFMSVITPLGMLRGERHVQLPSAWGHLEIDRSDVIRVTKQPKRTRARAVDRLFMAAMLRAALKPANVEYEAEVNRYRNELAEQFDRRVEERAKQRTSANETDANLWRELEQQIAAAGVPYVADKEVIEATVFVLKSKVLNAYDGVRKIRILLGAAVENIDAALREVGT